MEMARSFQKAEDQSPSVVPLVPRQQQQHLQQQQQDSGFVNSGAYLPPRWAPQQQQQVLQHQQQQESNVIRFNSQELNTVPRATGGTFFRLGPAAREVQAPSGTRIGGSEQFLSGPSGWTEQQQQGTAGMPEADPSQQRRASLSCVASPQARKKKVPVFAPKKFVPRSEGRVKWAPSDSEAE